MQRTTLSPRDAMMVRQVGKLGQMSSRQLRAALFHGVSQTPLDRSLSRLVRARYLAPVGRRASSAQGGAGAVVYQLGPRGWAMLEKPGRYWPYRSVNEHSLRAADAYIALLAAEREGHLKVLSFELERLSHHRSYLAEHQHDDIVEITRRYSQSAKDHLEMATSNLQAWFEVVDSTLRATSI